MPDLFLLFDTLSLTQNLFCFLIASGIVLLIGLKLSGTADILADRTGMGEALAGAILLGAATSASGIFTSISAASTGDIDLAYSNSLGGIAAQTAFLAIGDMCYRKVNLEHAAAEIANVTQAALLCLLLTIPLIAYALPQVTAFGVHPASLLLVALYIFGLFMARSDRKNPMWIAKSTPQTRTDEPDPENGEGQSTVMLVAGFIVMVVFISFAGLVIARTGVNIAAATGLKQSLIGAMLTAVATSLPELVTTIGAIRRGALQLAVGGIIGGNTFDVLFLSASDVAYRNGSIYGDIDASSRFWAVIGIAMTLVLLLGLIRREKTGPANIGVESAAVLVIYGSAALASAFVL
ncbi:MAG: cation transporter [Ponticaulis sp.]|nr:cation transporter [Ponticaulis sp.]